VIERIFESRFRDRSHGFRPGRGFHDALRGVDRLIIKDGYAHVVDADRRLFSTRSRMICCWRGSRGSSAMSVFSF
jgi:retron-type reverse transcriptase